MQPAAPELPTPAPPVPPPTPDSAPALPCANCRAILVGPFCAQCGQHVADYHRSVWRFLTDFLDNTFCWDNKLLRTLEPLVRRPGFLTREFMAGRRARYVHPLRLFLFTSAVCLALVGFISHHSKSPLRVVRFKADDAKAPPSRGSPAPNFSPTPGAAPSPELAGGKNAVAGQVRRELRERRAARKHRSSADKSPDGDEDKDNALDDRIDRLIDGGLSTAETITAKARQSAENGGGNPWTDPAQAQRIVQEITDGVEQRLSWVALALLPVFALLLRSVYWRQDSYYFAHLVFSLHYHAFLFLFWLAYVCLGLVTPLLPFGKVFDFLLGWCLLLPGWYLFAALRALYGDSRRRTAAKVFVLTSLHLLTIIIGVSLAGTWAYFSTRK